MQGDEDVRREPPSYPQPIVGNVLVYVMCVDHIGVDARDFFREHLGNGRNQQAMVMPQGLSVRNGEACNVVSSNDGRIFLYTMCCDYMNLMIFLMQPLFQSADKI